MRVYYQIGNYEEWILGEAHSQNGCRDIHFQCSQNLPGNSITLHNPEFLFHNNGFTATGYVTMPRGANMKIDTYRLESVEVRSTKPREKK